MAQDKISVIVNSEEPTEVVTSLLSFDDEMIKITQKLVELDTTLLASQLNETLNKIFGMFSKLPQGNEYFEIRDITFSVEIGASGDVNLLGAIGGSANGRTGITFSLSRNKNL